MNPEESVKRNFVRLPMLRDIPMTNYFEIFSVFLRNHELGVSYIGEQPSLYYDPEPLTGLHIVRYGW